MASSDALIVGEDWISEHYFTTDAKSESFQAKVAERRKAWDEDAKDERRDTVRSRFVAARGSLGVDSPTCSPTQPDVGDDQRCPTCTPSSARCSATTAASTR